MRKRTSPTSNLHLVGDLSSYEFITKSCALSTGANISHRPTVSLLALSKYRNLSLAVKLQISKWHDTKRTNAIYDTTYYSNIHS